MGTAKKAPRSKRFWVMLDAARLSDGMVRVAARPPYAHPDGRVVVRSVIRPPPAPDGRRSVDVLTKDLKKLVSDLLTGFCEFLQDSDVVDTLKFVADGRGVAKPSDQQKDDLDQATFFLGHLLRWSHGSGYASDADEEDDAFGGQLRLDVDDARATSSREGVGDAPARWFWCATASLVQKKKNVVASADVQSIPRTGSDAAAREALGAWDYACWISSSGLGVVARLVLLLDFLLEQYGDDLAEELQHDGLAPAQVLAALRKSLNRSSSAPASVETYYLVPWPIHRALAEALNRLPSRKHLLPVIYTDLVQQPFGPVLGIVSVNDYRYWLRHGVTPFMPQQAHGRDHESNHAARDWCRSNGASVLDAYRTHLHREDLGRPIMVLHSVTRPTWLTAIAEQITGAPDGAIQRPVIWLRAANPESANHLATVRAFLGPLCRAFGVTLWPETATPDVSQITMVLAALRSALWGTACIVVVDGVFNAGNTRIAPLLDYLRKVCKTSRQSDWCEA